MDRLSINSLKKLYAITFTCIMAWVVTAAGVYYFRDYGYGLFIWLPIVMGICTTIIFANGNTVTKGQCIRISFLALFIFCLGLLFFAMEGIICIIMAAPIGLLFNWIGVIIGYNIIKTKIINNPASTLIILVCSIPCLMSFECVTKSADDKLNITQTSIEINASPETVWKNVIRFPQLDEPTELLFKTGIAYPINATITGKGVGAIRNCNFSTGTFVEPITVWDSPRLLKFNVIEQPETMKELSFYDLHPNHLHGYFVSVQGQFKLTSLTNGHTLLQGTTWYYNNIKPNTYWILWCNYIVHKIHQRVLNHIKVVSEKG